MSIVFLKNTGSSMKNSRHTTRFCRAWSLFGVFCAQIAAVTLSAPKPQEDIPQVCFSNPYGVLCTCAPGDCIEGAIVEQVFLSCRASDREADGTIKRKAMLVRYPNALGTVVMCHGFMCDKRDQGFLRHLFAHGPYNVISFDFRAHGELSEGQVCTLGRDEAHEVTAAAQFIKHYPPTQKKPLFVYGFSMGAVAAIQAQARDNTLFEAMILDCPFDSSENVLRRLLHNVRFSILGYEFGLPCCDILEKYAFHQCVQSFIKKILKTVGAMEGQDIATRVCPVSTIDAIKKISVPVLFISCKNDSKVSVDAIKSIYEASNSAYKILWVTNGRGHFDSFFYYPEKYMKHIRVFLEDYFRNKKTHKQIIEDEDDGSILKKS